MMLRSSRETTRPPTGRTRLQPIGELWTILALAAGFAVAFQTGAGAVKTRADFDKAFDFSKAHTWAWSQKRGDIMVARTPEDDPELIRQRVEPIIMDAVTVELTRRGLEPAVGTPDLTVTYYLLLTIGASTQTHGQFLPAVTKWGIPPFTPSTTSIKAIEQGSLVLDLSAAGEMVFRGVGEASFKMGLEQTKRAALIHEAVRDILQRYPPRR